MASINKSAGNDDRFMDNEGEWRNGWRVTYQILNTFLKARKNDKLLIFLPFVKEGRSLPRKWNLEKGKKTASKNLLAAEKRLAEITPSKNN